VQRTRGEVPRDDTDQINSPRSATLLVKKSGVSWLDLDELTKTVYTSQLWSWPFVGKTVKS
jgi:hypothetical protein